MAQYAWREEEKQKPTATAAPSLSATLTPQPTPTPFQATTPNPVAQTPAPPAMTPAPVAAPSTTPAPTAATPAPPEASKSFYESLSAAKPPSMEAGLSDQARASLSEMLTPKEGPSAGSERALSDFDKQAQEQRRQELELSALSGRAATGQIAGDAQSFAQRQTAARADLSGELAAQDEQLDRDERLQAVQLIMQDEQFQKQFGLSKEQLDLQKVQVEQAADQFAKEFGLSQEQFDFAKQDAEFNRASDTATLLLSAFGDNPETSLQAAEIMFQAFGDVGYMTPEQVQAGVLNAAAGTFATPEEFTAYAQDRGASPELIQSIIAANTTEGGWEGQGAGSVPADVGGTQEGVTLATEYLATIDPKKIKAGVDLGAVGQAISENAAGNWDFSDSRFVDFLNSNGVQIATKGTGTTMSPGISVKDAKSNQAYVDAYMLNGLTKDQGFSQEDTDKMLTLALGPERLAAAKAVMEKK